MALIFPRLAHNFIKNGYFPTDELTLDRIVQGLDVGGARLRILDPCCGEGVALAECANHLQESGAVIESYGIDFDAERAWHAKTLLGRVAHSDVNDVFMSWRSQGLLFLNPPYGDPVSDKAATGDGKRERLEVMFYRKSVPWLQYGGVLILIVPFYVLTKEFSGLIARNFDRVQVFMAPEQQFKQCVIFGIRRQSDVADPKVVARLEACGRGEPTPVLPEHWEGEPYLVPEARAMDFKFVAQRIDSAQLSAELGRLHGHTLWPQFRRHFGEVDSGFRRPVRALSDWHLALALAAGQISGVVESRSGRKLLIKGDTFKDRDTTVTYEDRGGGHFSEVRTLTDKFVPSITAIDFTPRSNYGAVVRIR